MTEYEKKAACTKGCWALGAGVGLVLALVLWVVAGWTIIQAIFAGVVICVICGLLFTMIFCAKGSAPKVAPTVAARATTLETKAATAAPVAATAPAATESTAVLVKPSKALSGQAELATRKGDWKYQAPAPEAKPVKAKAKSAAKPAKAAAEKPAKAAPKAAKAAAPKADAKPKRAPVAADGKPELLKKARAGGADDLKLISGVGPKLEGMLNAMGVWHFDQVSSWRKKEVQWVNDNLEGFKGRIERDDWVAQAKILAKGGETEFSARKKK